MRFLHVSQWLHTPDDRAVIQKWTRPAPDSVRPGDAYTLSFPELTAPDEPWEFLVLGDTGDADAAGTGIAPQDAVARELTQHAASPVGAGAGRFVIHVGDVVYMTGEQRLYERNFRRPYGAFLTSASTVENMVFRLPFLPVPGNHDYYDLGGWAKWLARIPFLRSGAQTVASELFAFGLPQGGSEMGRTYMEAFVAGFEKSGGAGTSEAPVYPFPYLPGEQTRLPNRYYRFSHGSVDFFALDSNTLDAPRPDANGTVSEIAAEETRADARTRLKQMETRAERLDKLLERERRERDEQKTELRRALLADPTRRDYMDKQADSAKTALTALRQALETLTVGEAEAKSALGQVTRAEQAWEQVAAALQAQSQSRNDLLRVIEQGDRAGEVTCEAFLQVEGTLAVLSSGSPERAALTAASDRAQRAQAEWDEVIGNNGVALLDERIHTLTEKALDLERDLGVLRRRTRYQPADYDANQFAWLEAALSDSVREHPDRWRIVYLHHPLYTTIHNHCERPDVTGLRENLLAILQRHDVHLVLSGHSHAFEWFHSDALPHTGLFVTGGGGQISLRRSVIAPGRRARRYRPRRATLRSAGIQECAAAGDGPSSPSDGAEGPIYHHLRVRVSPDHLEIVPVGVRRLEAPDAYRTEAPMPVYHLPPDSNPDNVGKVRRLEAVEIRRNVPPQPRWTER